MKFKSRNKLPKHIDISRQMVPWILGCLLLMGATGAFASTKKEKTTVKGGNANSVKLNSARKEDSYVIQPDFNKAVVLKPDLFGTATYANLAGKKITGPILRHTMHALRPPVLRIPGGNAMNYWNWNTGLPKKYAPLMSFLADPSCDISTFKSKARRQAQNRKGILATNGPLTAEKWVRLADEGGSKLIWGLNVSTSRPDQTLKFMHYLKSKAITPKRFELGNELYFGFYACEMPSAKYFIKQAEKHANSIRKVFPEAKIAAPIFVDEARSHAPVTAVGLASKRNWNRALHADQSFYDAVVIHVYFLPFVRTQLGSSRQPTKREVSKWGAIKSSTATMTSIMDWVEKYWPGKKIWMTEWSLNNAPEFVPQSFARKYRLQHTVFEGLFNANVILNTASFKSSLVDANLWNLSSDFWGMVSNSGVKRPTYYVFKFLSKPAHTAGKVEHIHIDHVPTVKGPGKYKKSSAPLLDAYAFFDSKGKVTYLAFVNKMAEDATISINKFSKNMHGRRDYITPSKSSELLPGWGDANNSPGNADWQPKFDVVKDTVSLNSFTLPRWSFSVINVRADANSR